jgi:hypothetical protein
VAHVPDRGGGWQAAGFRMRRAANVLPSAPSLVEMMRMASCDQDLLEAHNWFLPHETRLKFRQGALLWLQLCVLEDKMHRLLCFAEAGSAFQPMLIQELEVERTWEVEEHSSWLAFEVEGRLQIRPQQYAIAQHMIDNPGSIVQVS